MAQTWDLARLQHYIDSGIEENIHLEYKSGAALQKEDGFYKEIAKDVSAMANSAGGLIIYGISEEVDRHLRYRPAEFSPVDRRRCSKETLEQVINSNIEPRISGIRIFPVPLPTDPNHVAYVVSVPQSDTVHQVTGVKRYYKRFNFESVPMEDYEIRDVMQRQGHPILEPRVGHMVWELGENGKKIWSVPIFVKNRAMSVGKDTAVTVQFIDATPAHQFTADRFVLKTQPKPSSYPMYIATFDEAIHRGLNKYFGTIRVTIPQAQSMTIRIQVFANGMRAKWWLVKLNFGESSATIQVLDEDYLY